MSENEDWQENGLGVVSSTGDPPIRTKEEDRLNRARFAEALAEQITAVPGYGGVVFGLLGPYGSGKTSILNMVEETLEESAEDPAVLWFNPWLFSETEPLVEHFFEELAAQLLEKPDSRLQRTGEALEQYGKLLGPLRYLPGVGRYSEGAGKNGVLGRRPKGREEKPASARTRRFELEETLRELDGKIVILIDDLDRLSRREEIQDIIRLVRLTADLPNVVFVLAFDRRPVEDALTRIKGDGRDYLEKIVQVVHDVPEIREVDLSQALIEEINSVIEESPTGPFDEREFWNVFYTIIRPFFRNVRDVRRYADALPMTFKVIGDEVRLVDVLVLEAIRLQAPDAFARLPEAAEALTTTFDGYGGKRSSDEARAEIESFEKAGGRYAEVIGAARRRLFPASSWVENTHRGSEWLKTWSKERRVAHPRVLAFYLEKHLPEDVMPAREVQDLFEALGDRDALTTKLGEMDSRTLEHALKRLEDYEDDYPPEHVEVAVEVLLNQLPRLREGREGSGDAGAETKLQRLVLKLLRKVEKQEDLAHVLETAMPRVETLSARLQLVEMVGNGKPAGQGLVAEEEVRNLEQLLLTALEQATSGSLAQERDLLRLLFWAQRVDAERGEALTKRLVERDVVFLAVLKNSFRENHSVAVGSTTPRVEHELAWDTMCELFGEQVVKRRTEELTKTRDTGEISPHGRTNLALDTAKRYAFR